MHDKNWYTWFMYHIGHFEITSDYIKFVCSIIYTTNRSYAFFTLLTMLFSLWSIEYRHSSLAYMPHADFMAYNI